MSESYLQRAINWVEKSEDVDIEQLESTIIRFVSKKKEHVRSPAKDKSVLDDLNKTISYLQNQLKLLSGVDDLPDMEQSTENDIESCFDREYKFDTSPLVPVSESDKVLLPKEARDKILEQLKQMPEISTGYKVSLK